MKILVYGAGALGSLLGAFLVGSNEVTLVGRAAHMDAVRKDGLRVEGVRRMDVRVEAKTAIGADDAPDLVLVSVQAFRTREAVAALAPCVRPQTVLVTVQNGLGNYETLLAAYPKNVVLGATVTYGAMLAAPGRIAYNGEGEILVGGTARQLDAAARVARLFRTAGLKARGVPEIHGHLWQKAIINVGINAVTALAGRPNGAILDDPALQARARRAVDEAAAVARALKVPLPEREPMAAVLRVAQATAANRSSMLQALSHGRRTEVDAINGAIVEAGRRVGVATPENEALWQAVRSRDRAV